MVKVLGLGLGLMLGSICLSSVMRSAGWRQTGKY